MALSPSEYGGHTQRNGIPPPRTPEGKAGHNPLAYENLRLLYRTGQTIDSTANPDGGEAFDGLLPEKLASELLPPPKSYPLPDA
jgi:hypothetical protein